MEDAERKKERKKKETATKIFWPPFFPLKKLFMKCLLTNWNQSVSRIFISPTRHEVYIFYRCLLLTDIQFIVIRVNM